MILSKSERETILKGLTNGYIYSLEEEWKTHDEAQKRILSKLKTKDIYNMDLMSLETTKFHELKNSEQNDKLESSLKLVVNLVLDALPARMGQLFIAKALDWLEGLAKKTNNKIDDIIVHALCNKAREILNIPEHPEDFSSELSQSIKSNMDKYTSEIDFGKTDTIKAIKEDIK